VHSFSRRLLVSVSIPLVLFFGLTIAGLDAIFRDLARRSLEEMLNAQLVALVSAAEPQAGGRIDVEPRGLESRLGTPGSGLYAQIRSVDGALEWRSPSAVGTFIDFGAPVGPGERRVQYATLPDGTRIAIASRGFLWETKERQELRLVFRIASSLRSYDQQLLRFRSQLFGWFTVLTLALLGTLGVLLRWVLTPVRRLEAEIAAMESGERAELGSGYPRELAGVTRNLNALLAGERRRVARYRDTLGNLAHSLKTPLAVMRSMLGGREAVAPQALDAEIQRMSSIIEHQMRRAAASGGTLLGQAPIEVARVAGDVRGALLKIYGGKDVGIELRVPAQARFVGDGADFTEMLGNLLDNACKWCRERVVITAAPAAAEAGSPRIAIMVDDDGPGIPADALRRVGERGVRADENTPGHGLGLAMVRDSVELYGGRFAIEHSPLGGARVVLTLPGRI
jgi:two-component system sensor histidine kinase PhoQ